jgi:hypothetical protein
MRFQNGLGHDHATRAQLHPGPDYGRGMDERREWEAMLAVQGGDLVSQAGRTKCKDHL